MQLAPGARLRSHRGPGGRLVAHLGVQVPAENAATLTVAGETRGWTQGGLLVFDDAYEHHAQNLADVPRIVLHLTFPKPLAPPAASAPQIRCLVKMLKMRFKTYGGHIGGGKKRPCAGCYSPRPYS